MIRKLKTLVITLILSSTTFSQKDTSKICFDYKIAQSIVTDLVKGDAAIEELKKTQELVLQLNETIIEKNSVINDYIKKDSTCIKQVSTFTELKQKQDNIIFGLEKDVESLKKENQNLKTGIKWVGGGFVGVLISLLTLSLIK
jgi:wobble nucleotide-excising tRNase